MPSPLILRRRLRSIRSTRKITHAMELVAAAKMKRAVDSVLASRPYTRSLSSMLVRLSPLVNAELHPLLRVAPELRQITLVVFSSDRGLCGAFNSALSHTVMEHIARFRRELPSVRIGIVSVGKKARDASARARVPILADFPRPHRQSRVADVSGISRLLIEEFTTEKTDLVTIVTTDFVSALTQRPMFLQLLPLPTVEHLSRSLLTSGLGMTKPALPASATSTEQTILFEPSRKDVLDALLPRAVELMLYQALLESIASEHASRRFAMKNATDAAKDIIEDLELTANQTRQATITREMAEITTAMTAMN